MSNLYTPALKGVHIDVSLPITRLGQPESFQDVEFLEIRFVNNRLSDQLVVYTADKIKLTDNVVSVVIPDTDSSRLQLGFYDVQFAYRKTNVLRPNQYEPFKLVVPAFALVATTAELGVDVATDVEVQSVVINGEIYIARDGLNGASAFQIWKAFIGTPGSTELDYLAWLRQPADDAATEFEDLTDQFNTFNAAANTAETYRNTKETERNENESIRLVDEQLRKNAEAARVLAEQTRQQNESDRETLFDQSVSESAQATAAANTAAAAANAAANAQNAYNVTVAVPLAAGVYYTKATARAAVPVASRKIGLVNTYALSASTWYTEKYIGANVSGWTTETNWEQVPDAARVAALETNLNEKTSKLDLDQKINAVKITPGNNLLNRNYVEPSNPYEYERGGADRLIHPTTGVVVDYPSWYISPLIDWQDKTQAIISSCRCWAQYAEDGVTPKGIYYPSINQTNLLIDRATDAKYIRVGLGIGTGNNMMNFGNVLLPFELYMETVSSRVYGNTQVYFNPLFKDMLLSESYTPQSPTYTDGVVNSPINVIWADGDSGVLTLTRNSDGLVTKIVATKIRSGVTTTLTENITRDSDGNATNITIA